MSGIEIEKTRINLFNAVGFLVLFAGGVTSYVLQGETAKKAVEKADTLAVELTRVKEKISPLDMYAYRQGEADKAVVETNKRIDRVVDSMNSKFDAMLSGVSSIKEDIAGVKSDVRLLGQKLEERPQRTRFGNLEVPTIK